MEPDIWSQDRFDIAPDVETAAAPVTRRANWFARALVWLFGAWAVVIALFFLLAMLTSPDPVTRAIAGMALGLFLFWIVLGGTLSLLLRRRVRSILGRFDAHWRIAFVLFATLLALLEEAVTTTMTNAASLWGVPVGKAYITASANYLEVVLYHSVVVFVPMFIVWAWLLKRYAFSPAAVFVLYGCTGALAETGTFGAQNLVGLGFWVYVYGLMVYLPACAIPPERGGRKPGVWACLLALILPILAAIPVALIILALNPPQHAFAPIR
ncbi:MAG TPA: hypothetical protein VH349_11840 [Ktedonobacterales bacterium]|jgi:hypothetical protein